MIVSAADMALAVATSPAKHPPLNKFHLPLFQLQIFIREQSPD
jgi:hypothetical protein